MSRVPYHFPHIYSCGPFHLPRCSCSWIGRPQHPSPLGEQLARNEAIDHALRGDFVKVSSLVAYPVYSDEVDM